MVRALPDKVNPSFANCSQPSESPVRSLALTVWVEPLKIRLSPVAMALSQLAASLQLALVVEAPDQVCTAARPASGRMTTVSAIASSRFNRFFLMGMSFFGFRFAVRGLCTSANLFTLRLDLPCARSPWGSVAVQKHTYGLGALSGCSLISTRTRVAQPYHIRGRHGVGDENAP